MNIKTLNCAFIENKNNKRRFYIYSVYVSVWHCVRCYTRWTKMYM